MTSVKSKLEAGISTTLTVNNWKHVLERLHQVSEHFSQWLYRLVGGLTFQCPSIVNIDEYY